MSAEINAARFEEFWQLGPWQKRDKAAAFRRFSKTVKTDEDWQDIQLAREEYARYCRDNRWYTPKFGGTFMSSWRDWLQSKNKQREVSDPLAHDLIHSCVACMPAHDWSCEHRNPLCSLDKEVPCPDWIERFQKRRGLVVQ